MIAPGQEELEEYLFSIFFSMKVCCVFSLEFDSSEYTQYTIFYIKEKIPLIIPNLQLRDFHLRDSKTCSKQPW